MVPRKNHNSEERSICQKRRGNISRINDLGIIPFAHANQIVTRNWARFEKWTQTFGHLSSSFLHSLTDCRCRLRLPALLIESSGTACDSLREIIPVCSYLLMIISKFIYFITHVLFCLPFSATKGWQKQWDVGREGLMVRIMVWNILFSFERIGRVVRWKLMRWWFN